MFTASRALRLHAKRAVSSGVMLPSPAPAAATVLTRSLHASALRASSRWQQYTADLDTATAAAAAAAVSTEGEAVGETVGEEGELLDADEEVEFDQDAFDKEYKLFPEALLDEWVAADKPDPNSLVEARAWEEGSRRTGIIGKKMGMISLWDHWGKQFHCTVVHFNNCQVVSVNNTENRFGQIQLELGTVDAKPKNVNKQQLVHFKKAGVAPKQKLMSFPVSRDAILPPGYVMDARHFVPGQHVDVRGTTIGKGFQGVMKRHNFKGQPASHGASLSHRSGGSIGQNTSPGKVWKNKKMPGRMGGKRRTLQNVEVVKIDTKRNLLFLRGQIPGYAGNWVAVKDAVKKPFKADNPPPYPTYVPSEKDSKEQYWKLPDPENDPYAF